MLEILGLFATEGISGPDTELRGLVAVYTVSNSNNRIKIIQDGSSIIAIVRRIQNFFDCSGQMHFARIVYLNNVFLSFYSFQSLLPAFSLPLFIFSFFQKSLQQEGEEIRECVELPVPPDVLVAQLDSVLHIGIGFPLDEIV